MTWESLSLQSVFNGYASDLLCEWHHVLLADYQACDGRQGCNHGRSQHHVPEQNMAGQRALNSGHEPIKGYQSTSFQDPPKWSYLLFAATHDGKLRIVLIHGPFECPLEVFDCIEAW
jgi:hypothetical protein